MFRFVIQWVLSTIVLMILIRAVPGFFTNSVNAGLMVCAGLGLANAVLGFALRQMKFPLAIVLFALCIFGANFGLIWFCSAYVDNFYIYNNEPALWAAGALTTLLVILRFAMTSE